MGRSPRPSGRFFGCLFLERQQVRPLPGWGGPPGQWNLYERQLFQNAGCPTGCRALNGSGRRSTWLPGCCGIELRILAGSFWRGRRRGRRHDFTGPSHFSNRGGQRTRLLRRGDRPEFRRGGPGLRGGYFRRQRIAPRTSFLVVAEDHRPPKARNQCGADQRAARRDLAGGFCRRLAARLGSAGKERFPQAKAGQLSGGDRNVISSQALRRAAPHPDGRGRTGAAHRLRQYRQSDAGPRRREKQRNRRAQSSWSNPSPPDSPTADGMHLAFLGGSRLGNSFRSLGKCPIGTLHLDRKKSGVLGPVAGWPRAGLHRLGRRSHRHTVRRTSRTTLDEGFVISGDERPAGRRERAPGPIPSREVHRSLPSGAFAGPAGHCRLVSAQLREAGNARHRLRPQQRPSRKC